MALLTNDEMEYFENKIFSNAAIDELEIKEVSSLSHSGPVPPQVLRFCPSYSLHT